MIVALRFLLAALLYLFLGVAFFLLWRDLRRGEKTPPPPPEAYLQLGEEPPMRLRPITALGRAGDNTLVLDDPFVSAHHALVLWRDERWWLEDLESHNGTFLNGERVSSARPLTSGDRIRLGETQLRFWES